MISIVCTELCVNSQGVLLLLLLLLPKEVSSCCLACSMRALWPEDGLLPLLPLPELRLRCGPLLCAALLQSGLCPCSCTAGCMHALATR